MNSRKRPALTPAEALRRLRSYDRPLRIMEVCGTHTAAIAAHGLRSLLSPAITLVSGPGCPVCVTPPSVIDGLIDHAGRPDHLVLAFGDLFRARGSRQSLAEAKAEGASVLLVYSPLEAVALAREHPGRTLVVAAVGFETTAPVYAVLLERLVKHGIGNVKLLTALKTMPPILRHICRHESLDAFICPGHVTTIIGCQPYEELARAFRKPFVVAGFEAEHLVAAIHEIAVQHERGDHQVKNLYPSAVSGRRQVRAWELMERYFEEGPAAWRGIGMVADSGLFLRKEFAHFDCAVLETEEESPPEGCRCGDVMLGRIGPDQCPLFGRACAPDHAVGPCMVSSEGACGIRFSQGDVP